MNEVNGVFSTPKYFMIHHEGSKSPFTSFGKRFTDDESNLEAPVSNPPAFSRGRQQPNQERKNMPENTLPINLPSCFVARGPEFTASILRKNRYACGTFWGLCNLGWCPTSKHDIDLSLRVVFKVHPRYTSTIRKLVIIPMSQSIADPEWEREIRCYARVRGLQLIDGRWERVPQSKWDAMSAEEYAALIMLEYDESKFSPEDWQKLADLHAEEIKLRRGSGKRIDQARRKNRIGGTLTSIFVRYDIDQIRQQRHEIIERACPSVAS